MRKRQGKRNNDIYPINFAFSLILITIFVKAIAGGDINNHAH